METIPFLKVTLLPFNRENEDLLFSLDEDICSSWIKRAVAERYNEYGRLCGFNYPTEKKDFYIVPIKGMNESFRNFNLQLASFSALWLPSIVVNSRPIFAGLPKDAGRVTINGYNPSFSEFAGDSVLTLDIISGISRFVLWQNDICQFSHIPGCWVLAEFIIRKD